MTRLGRFVRLAFLAGDVRAFRIINQLAFALLLGLTTVLLDALRAENHRDMWMYAGIGMLVLATVSAFTSGRIGRSKLPDLVIPLLDFAALGLCRFGTYPDGGALSTLVFIPTVWLVFALRTRGAVVATPAVLASVSSVSLFGSSTGSVDAAQILLTAVLPVAVVFVASIIIGFDLRLRAGTRRLLTALSVQEHLTGEAKRTAAVLRATGESLDVGVLALDEAGQPIFENPAFKQHCADFLSLEPDQQEGAARVFESDGATPLTQMRNPLNRARRGESFKDELIWVGECGDGQRALSVSAKALPGHSPSGLRTIILSSDVTATQHLMRAREEFTASVSHELRTPLTSIIGYTELALDELIDDPATENSAVVGHLGVIQRNSEQLFALVEDILLEQQAGSHRLQLNRTNLDLGDLIEEVVGALCPAATEHGVRLALGEVDHLHIDADEKRLTQVLTNLVFNAIKYSGTGRTVTVSSAAEAASVGFDVVDDGRGIDSADLEHLFSPFFRGASAQTSTKRGVGLGLTVTKSIVDAHGGTITVDSALGRGTRFSVRIPKTAEGVAL